MNRLVVRQAARGSRRRTCWRSTRGAATRGVVIGYDARRKSDVFALDTARVIAAAGRARARCCPGRCRRRCWRGPSPSSTRAAGVMVTASHNPPADNGYKVYLGDGAQIVPPHDAEIAARIAAVDPTAVALADADDDPLIERLGRVDRRPLRRLDARRCGCARRPPGVARRLHADARRRRRARRCGRSTRPGCPAPVVVEEQFQPDPAFPTVSFPNPEEPGAMDLVIALADAARAPLVALANDPDADRLGAAIPQPDGSWRRLGGDEIGWLLADHILTNTAGDDRLVVTTLVSSSLLQTMADDYGVHFAETFTGFKWIGRAVLDRPDLRFVFAYEQALGYLVAPRPLDKDGISAAVLLAEIAAVAADEGTTMQGRLDDIAARYGRHVIAERSVRMAPDVGAERVCGRCRTTRRRRSAGVAVVDVRAVPRGRPAAPDPRGRRPRPGPPERHRTQGQALRRSRRRRPHPLPRRPGSRFSNDFQRATDGPNLRRTALQPARARRAARRG